MIKESGRVVSVEEDHMWVQTVRKSACSTCSAEKGCGQSLLSKWGQEPGFIRVDLSGRDHSKYKIDDTVTIAIGEGVLLKASLALYLLPLVFLMVGIFVGHSLGLAEAYTVLTGAVGLIAGALFTRKVLDVYGKNQSLEPVLVEADEDVVYWAEGAKLR